jgi:type II secretory pathway pseudopilin PulG
MPVAVLLIVLVVLFAGSLFAADRAVKAIKRGRRRAEASRRLAAAAARAQAQDSRRRAAAEASAALTSVLPVIGDHAPRHVDQPHPRTRDDGTLSR